MALSGTLQTLSVAEIFQTLSRTAASGVLSLDAVDMACDVVFDGGRIIQVYDRSPGSEVTLVQRLSAWGALGEQVLPGGSAGSSGSWRSVQLMVEQGRADEESVGTALEELALAQLYDLFTWEEASFTFTELGQSEEADLQVEVARQRPVVVTVDSVLMESARRLDEWGRVRSQLPTEAAVFAPAEGGEVVLEKALAIYPDRAVVPLINGVRSLEELVAESPATRLDVYSTVTRLVEAEAIVALDPEQMKASGAYYQQAGDTVSASRLYRHALACDPQDQAVCRSLAEILEQMGDPPEAAACYRQLALAYLADEQFALAWESAQQAVRLAGRHSVRERQVVIQCCERMGDLDAARRQRLELGWLQIDLGQWHAAQRNGTELLQLDPTDHEACHLLARAIAMNDEFSCGDDETICIMCTALNPRSTLECASCGAPLRLPCSACGREIAVSDRVCLYCGCDPHQPGQGFADLEDLDTKGDDAFESRLREAARLLDQGQGTRALGIWQKLAEERPDDHRLRVRMREVAAEVQRRHVADLVEKARHRHKRRRYMGAYRAYQAALTGMAEDDPRRLRLMQLSREAQREWHRNGMIYGAAALAAALALGLLGWERWRIHAFRRYAAETVDEARDLARSGGFTSFAELQSKRLELSQRALALGDPAVGHWEVIDEILEEARDPLLRGDLDQIATLLEAGRVEQATVLLKSVRDAYGPNAMRERQQELVAQIERAALTQEDLRQRRERDPRRMQEVRDLVGQQRLQAAWDQVAVLRDSPVAEVAAAAREVHADLARRRQALDATFVALETRIQEDYQQARADIEGVIEQAGYWGQTPAVEDLRRTIDRRIAEAEAAFERLQGEGGEVAQLTTFLSEHAGSRHAPQVLRRLQAAREGIERRRALAVAYRKAMVEEDWVTAHAHALALNEQHDHRVAMPLLVESRQPGATVVRNGEAIGRTPLLIEADHGASDRLRIERPGCDPVDGVVADLQTSWRWSVVLQRRVLWRTQVDIDIHHLRPWGDQLLVVGAQGLLLVDGDGRIQVRRDIPDDSLGGRPAWQRTLRLDPESILLVGMQGLVGWDVRGQETIAMPLTTEAVAPPLLYHNDLFGVGRRLALAGDDLLTGPVDGQLQAAGLPDRPVAGPVLIGDSMRQVLVVGTVTGRLRAFDETRRTVAWSLDCEASHLSGLQRIDDALALVVADESRILAFAATPERAALRWQVGLPGRLLAAPMLVEQGLMLASEAGIHRVDGNGVLRPVVEQTSRAVAIGDHALAVIGQDGILYCYDSTGGLRWQRNLGPDAHGVAVVGSLIVAASEAGIIQAFGAE